MSALIEWMPIAAIVLWLPALVGSIASAFGKRPWPVEYDLWVLFAIFLGFLTFIAGVLFDIAIIRGWRFDLFDVIILSAMVVGIGFWIKSLLGHIRWRLARRATCRAEARWKAGDYRGAADHYSRCIRLFPEHGPFYHARAETYKNMGFHKHYKNDRAKAAKLEEAG